MKYCSSSVDFEETENNSGKANISGDIFFVRRQAGLWLLQFSDTSIVLSTGGLHCSCNCLPVPGLEMSVCSTKSPLRRAGGPGDGMWMVYRRERDFARHVSRGTQNKQGAVVI